MKLFSIVVAVDEKMGIGKGNVLPWRLSKDMQRFKDVTIPAPEGKVNAVVMGRKTWESLPVKFRPLPGRLNIVLSRHQGMVLPSGVLQAGSFDHALRFVDGREDVDGVFVIGGGEVFSEALAHPRCRGIYLTRVSGVFSCDVFFPAINSDFQMVSSSELLNEGGLSFRFCDLLATPPIPATKKE